MRKGFILFLCLFLAAGIFPAQAQQSPTMTSGSGGVFSAQKEARNMAVIKAVSNYKINDEEVYKDVAQLRENQRFNNQLQGMLNKLSNSRTKNSKNRQVYKILQQAGEDIYNVLK